jgi:hypothetical protein
MDTDSVLVIDVETGLVLRVVTTILRQLLLLVVVLTLYVLVVFIHVTPETVVDVVDVLLM